MKVEVKEGEKKFTPIVLEVVVESEAELCDLWYRMNASKRTIDDTQGCLLRHRCLPAGSYFLIALDGLVKEKGLEVQKVSD